MVTRAKRSVIASPVGLKRLEEKRRISGKSAEVIGDLAGGVSRSLVQKFFRGEPISVENFQSLCDVLELNWKEIAELEEVESSVASRKRVAFVIEGSLDDLDPTRLAKLQAMVRTLQRLTGDASITVVDVEEGSIRLILEGSEEGIEGLKQLFDRGVLDQFLDISVRDIEPIHEDIFGTEEIEDWLKALLIAAICCDAAVGADLSGADLSGADLNGANLSGADLTGVNFSGADLSGANLRGANLTNADLSDANLSNANLGNTSLEVVNLSGANFTNADLSGTYFSDVSRAVRRTVNFIGANLSGANFIGANFSEDNGFGGISSIRSANFSSANLSGADFSGANLSGVNLSGANLRTVNLNRAYLRKTNFSGANLEGANLEGSSLIGCYLTSTNLSGANLSGANLGGAHLFDTDLSSANLSGANLGGAHLFDIDLSGADVKNARFGFGEGLSDSDKADLKNRGAIFDDFTNDREFILR
jgi:uncharacterized protein YjbI with pentapeptide repeats